MNVTGSLDGEPCYVIVYENGLVHNLDGHYAMYEVEAKELARSQNRIFNGEGLHYVAISFSSLTEALDKL